MKKSLVILAVVAFFALSVSSSFTGPIISENTSVELVAEADNQVNTEIVTDDKKDKKKQKATPARSCCSQKEPVKTECSEAQQKSCAASKVTCPAEKKSEKK
jgi:hypothetical protein